MITRMTRAEMKLSKASVFWNGDLILVISGN